MNIWQESYVAWLAGIFWVRNPNPALWVLLANCAATLAACEAMDLGWLQRAPGHDDATMAQMLIDFVSLAVLLNWRGLAWVIAAGYAATVPIYSLTLIFGMQTSTTFAIVVGIGYVQLLVASGGSSGGNGHRRLHRLAGLFSVVAAPVRTEIMGSGGIDEGGQVLSPDRGM